MDNIELERSVAQYKDRLFQERLHKAHLIEQKRFQLDEDCIRSILDNRVMPKHREIRYEIYRAKYTNSYYVKFWLNNCYVTTRLSDHDSYVGAIGLVVDTETTKAQIVNIFEKRIHSLKKKSKLYCFKVIETKGRNYGKWNFN